MTLRRIFLVLIGALPFSGARIWAFRTFMGYKIARNVYIGFSLLDIDMCEIGEGVNIGHLNQITGFELIKLESHSKIGNLNRFIGSSRKDNLFQVSTNRRPEFFLGNNAMITSRHFFDVQDSIEIGSFTTIAGAGLHVWTHQIDIVNNQQTAKAVSIGDYCYICSQVTFLPGSQVPDYCVVGACSVVVKTLEVKYALYAGNPAVLRKSDLTGAYFNRETGYVS
jgi:acetyltransferase-like isoleucine patch superfamily enzyme